jgi:pyocin large subunit-like protein
LSQEKIVKIVLRSQQKNRPEQIICLTKILKSRNVAKKQNYNQSAQNHLTECKKKRKNEKHHRQILLFLVF